MPLCCFRCIYCNNNQCVIQGHCNMNSQFCDFTIKD